MVKLFEKEHNEQIAINYLKEYDAKYKNLEKSECPDFSSEQDSIGVEVTLVEFDGFIKSYKYIGKSLKEFIAMNNIKPQKKKDFAGINKIINTLNSKGSKDILLDFINSYYYRRGDSILKLHSIEEYKNLDPNTNLYPKLSFPSQLIIEDQIIIGHLPFICWTGQIVDKYIEKVKIKNEKLKEYKKFDENSLLIINYTADIEETLKFEKRIRKIDGIDFDKIFVLNPLFEKNIYEIDLRKMT